MGENIKVKIRRELFINFWETFSTTQEFGSRMKKIENEDLMNDGDKQIRFPEMNEQLSPFLNFYIFIWRSDFSSTKFNILSTLHAAQCRGVLHANTDKLKLTGLKPGVGGNQPI